MPNFSSLARLEVPEKFLWWVGWVGWGGVCKVIFVSNPTVVLCCVGVGVLTIMHIQLQKKCKGNDFLARFMFLIAGIRSS